MINLLQKYYESDDFLKVINYIFDKPYLIALILELPKQVRKVFPNESLELKVIYDPEIPNWENLAVFIVTGLDAEQTFNKLQQLDQTWWLEASDLACNKLQIHISFNHDHSRF